MEYTEIKSSVDSDGPADMDLEDSSLLRSAHSGRHSRKALLVRVFNALPWLLNACLLVSVLVLVHQIRLEVDKKSDNLTKMLAINSPAPELIDYKPVSTKKGVMHHGSAFQGMPTDEKDQLWEDSYMRGITIRLSPDRKNNLINQTEHIPMPGYEGDYVVGLDVFHRLHCLNYLRKALYPRRYSSSILNSDGTVDFRKWAHLDHCIEMLREALTCHADVNIIAYQWDPITHTMDAREDTMHMCQDFSKIQDWAFSRSVNMNKGAVTGKHVEDGKIVDYSKLRQEHDPTPEGWNYTVDDL